MSDQGNPQDPWGQQPQQPQYEPPPPSYEPPPPSYEQPQQPQYEPPQQPGYGAPPPPAYPSQGYPPGGYPPPGDPAQGYPTQGYGAPVPPADYPTQAYGAPLPPPPPGTPLGEGAGGGSRRGLWALLVAVVVIILAVLAYFLFSSSSSGASTPQDAAKKLLDAGKALDVGAAKKVLCAADQRLPQFVKPAESDRIASYSIGAVTKKDSTHATVSVSLTTKDGTSANNEQLPVKKEGGKWKVCVSDLISSLPSGLPSSSATHSSAGNGAPSDTTLPTGIPTDLFPSGLPSDLPGGNFCANSDAFTTAETYIGAAEIGASPVAQACVFHNAVSQDVAKTLSGKLYAPKGTGPSSGSASGPSATYDFVNSTGAGTASITVTKEPDGKYYVTAVTTG